MPGRTTSVSEGRTARYDGEGRVDEVTAALIGATERWQYHYDGEGRRVRTLHTRTQDNVTTVKNEVDYVYDADGQLLAEYAVVGNSVAAEGRRYVTADWLGSTRVETDGTTGAVVSRRDYLPFGETVREVATGPRVKFTGKERDEYAGASLDYFGARYLSVGQGRFTSPDEPLIDQFAGDPQSWNLYSYTRSNPLTFVDPNGRQAEEASPCKTTKDPSCIASVDSVLRLHQKIKGVTRAAANTGIDGVNLLLWIGYGFANATANGAYSGLEPFQVPYLSQDEAYQRFEDNVFLAMTPLHLPRLLQAMRMVGRGGILTRIGHALQKHGGRPGSAFPKPSGNEHQVNQIAERVASEILGDPRRVTREYIHPRHGQVLEVFDSKGRGMQFSGDQVRFIGLLEPEK